MAASHTAIDRRALITGRLLRPDRVVRPPSGEIASILVQARPERLASVEAAIVVLDGCEIYGRDRGTITRSPSGVYTIDPGNGATFNLDDPDFNFRSLLGNAVLRWEYRPGSTLFVVWQQRRTDVEPLGDFDFSRDYRGLLDHAPENVFAVKATYWIGL